MQCPSAPRTFNVPFRVDQIDDVVNFRVVRDLGRMKMCAVPFSRNNSFAALSEDDKYEVYEKVLAYSRANM